MGSSQWYRPISWSQGSLEMTHRHIGITYLSLASAMSRLIDPKLREEGKEQIKTACRDAIWSNGLPFVGGFCTNYPCRVCLYVSSYCLRELLHLCVYVRAPLRLCACVYVCLCVYGRRSLHTFLWLAFCAVHSTKPFSTDVCWYCTLVHCYSRIISI